MTFIRTLIWFVLAALAMLAAVWLAERPGSVTVVFRGDKGRQEGGDFWDHRIVVATFAETREASHRIRFHRCRRREIPMIFSRPQPAARFPSRKRAAWPRLP